MKAPWSPETTGAQKAAKKKAERCGLAPLQITACTAKTPAQMGLPWPSPATVRNTPAPRAETDRTQEGKMTAALPVCAGGGDLSRQWTSFQEAPALFQSPAFTWPGDALHLRFLPTHLRIPPTHHRVRVTAPIREVWSPEEERNASNKAWRMDTDL